MHSNSRITIQQIALLAGVDKSIVSKVANGVSAGQVSASKRSHIESLIREHHYVPHSAARSLARRCNQQLAFLLTGPTENSFANSAFSQMLSGFAFQCRSHGYQCQVLALECSELSNFLQPENLHRLSIDGCVLAGTFAGLQAEQISEIQMPLLLLGWEYLRGVIPVISRDSWREYSVMLEYSLALGHRHILYDTISPSSQATIHKLIAEYPGVVVDVCPTNAAQSEFTLAAETAEAFAALPAGQRPSILWGSDQFCCSFATHLQRHGLSCPTDISIIAYSESWAAAYYHPPLTTFSLDFFALGKVAVDLMLQILSDKLDLQAACQLANNYIPQSIWRLRQSVRDISKKP